MELIKRRKIERILARMEEAGELSPEAIVQAARDRRSPLHDQFEWDDKSAAHQHRIEQARALIRSIKTTVVVHGRRVIVPVYTHDPSKREAGYTSVAKIKTEDVLAREALDAEIKRALGILERARSIAIALNLEPHFESVMKGAVDLRTALWGDQAAQ